MWLGQITPPWGQAWGPLPLPHSLRATDFRLPQPSLTVQFWPQVLLLQVHLFSAGRAGESIALHCGAKVFASPLGALPYLVSSSEPSQSSGFSCHPVAQNQGPSITLTGPLAHSHALYLPGLPPFQEEVWGGDGHMPAPPLASLTSPHARSQTSWTSCALSCCWALGPEDLLTWGVLTGRNGDF